MKKENIYLVAGIVAFFYGSCMIHFGLGLMLFGVMLLLCAFAEYDKNHKTEEEDKQ